ncbi:MAG TPA: preprotein translocase subunit SecE [Vicinamibacterales bacterium]
MKTASMENTKDTPLKRDGGAGVLGKPLEWWHRSRTFLAEVRGEMRRVTWPSRKEVYATTIVVIITSIFFGTYLWGLDLLFAQLVNWIFGLLGAA